MKTPVLPRRIPDAPRVGAKAAFTRTFTEADVALFIGVTWDLNPYHTDETFASQTRFRGRIVPGLLTASLLTHLGGMWAFLATSMHFEFLGPVYVGDSITAEAEVMAVDENRKWVHLSCLCTNSRGEEVLRADVRGYPGNFEPIDPRR